MLPLLAQVAFSTLVSLWFGEVFRAKEKTQGASGKGENALPPADSELKTQDSPMTVSGLDNALRIARLHRLVGAAGTGHYVPLDAQLLNEALRPETLEEAALADRISGFPGNRAGRNKGQNTMFGSIGAEFDIVGADLMFGAADSDILEALAVSGDGSSEIIGAELIGALKKAAASGSAAAKKALHAVAMRNAGAVIKNDLKNRRRYPLGFVPTEVDSGDAATIPAAPQNLFRPERLVIPSDICFDFGVQDIKVGNQSQFAQSVEVPAAVFSEVSIDTNVTFDTAEVGNQISILVRNKGTTDNLEFTAAAIGTIAKA